jgi:antibiotic biosynthesis monooxygenase (ABM) superfamily enzyme
MEDFLLALAFVAVVFIGYRIVSRFDRFVDFWLDDDTDKKRR